MITQETKSVKTWGGFDLVSFVDVVIARPNLREQLRAVECPPRMRHQKFEQSILRAAHV